MDFRIKALIVLAFLSILSLFGQENEFTLPEFPTPPVMEIPLVTPSSDEMMEEGKKASPEIDGNAKEQAQ